MSKAEASSVVRSIAKSLAILCKHCGIELDEVLSAFKEAYGDKHLPVGHIEEGVALLTAYKVDLCSAMMHRWRDDSAYLDEMGETKAIRITGEAPSLQDLYLKTIAWLEKPEEPVSEAECIQILTENDTIKVNDNGTVSAVGYGVRVGNSSSGALVQLGYVESMANTAANNLIHGGRWHLESRVADFPKSKLGLLNALLNDKGSSFIEEADGFMEEQRENRTASEETTDVGVCLFMSERKKGQVGPTMKKNDDYHVIGRGTAR